MRLWEKGIIFTIVFSLFFYSLILTSCTPISSLKKPLTENPKVELAPVISDESDYQDNQTDDIDYSLDLAEYYYALGVNNNRDGKWEKAQDNFEKALEILSNLDVSADSEETNQRFTNLLNEIQQDYHYTLTSRGILADETSHSAFLELFSDIKNFKKLRESLSAKQVAVPESVSYDIPIETNQRVQNSLIYLQTIAKRQFALYLSRMGKYKDLMSEIIREYDLPGDLVYLPLIESGFNPKAYSYARASGPWQFISSTGRIYGLKRNWWYDERRDFVKSTHAACKYLKALYERFGDWKLALAAYNAGEGSIQRAIKRQGTKDFWKLRLRKQTRDYIPLYMAATIAAKNTDRFGFVDIKYEDPITFDVVTVNKVMDLKHIASKLGISYKKLKELNPELLRGVTPPNYPDYQLRIPAGLSEKFAEVYPSIPGEKASNWVTHRVRRGETLSTIAQRYGVSISAISTVNKIRRRGRIYVGQKLMIPVPDGSYRRKYKPKSYGKTKVKTKDGVYVVRRGDSLWDIARMFNTTVTNLKKLNNLRGRNPRVYPGDTIKVSDKKGNKTSKKIVHIVHRGDTLWSIAKRYNTTVADIRKWNNLSLSKLIMPGDRIKIYYVN